ncbi:O-antigen ligase family protein [Negadavirga shengliensis]|uniref:O-antigen ligase family protein n=1 Tax=Negadavirga shengliensis TaxID=1389218 RepID=A0ABV9SXZ9_9BACT
MTIGIRDIWMLLSFVVLGGLVQAVYGELQLLGIYPSLHAGFPLTGSFFNPGPYAGYLAVVFPSALGLYLFTDQWPGFSRKWLKLLIKYISLATVLGILLILPVAASRAAWIAVAVSGGLLCFYRFRWYEKLGSLMDTRLNKFSVLILGAGIWVVALIGIYMLKKDSADGRVLIWKASLNMIRESPFLGTGFDRFKASYMEAQASYFRENSDDSTEFLASDVFYAFNEGIQLFTEQGMIGFLLVVVLLLVVFGVRGSGNKPEIWIAQAGLSSLLLFGMFSYPSHILSIKLCGIVCLAVLAVNSKQLYRLSSLSIPPIRWAVAITMTCLSVVILWRVQEVYKANKDWNDALSYYNKGAYTISLDKYEKVLPVFIRDGEFLCNFGKALSVAGEHIKAVVILEEAKNYLGNTIVQTALGDSYKALGMYDRAEAAYQLASDMLPDRFYPKYLLVKLYMETGEEEKMKAIARFLLEKEPKIPSQAVEEIKEEMRGMLGERLFNIAPSGSVSGQDRQDI